MSYRKKYGERGTPIKRGKVPGRWMSNGKLGLVWRSEESIQKQLEAAKRWRDANKEKYKEYNRRKVAKAKLLGTDRFAWRKHGLKQKFGMTVEPYAEMETAQNGLCAICHKPENVLDSKGRVRPLAVDHDHVTGRVRALLCTRCNSILGFSFDDPVILQSAIDYLEKQANYAKERTEMVYMGG